MSNNLPAVDSVWGVVDRPETWIKIAWVNPTRIGINGWMGPGSVDFVDPRYVDIKAIVSGGATSMRCPQCNDGFAGTDATGDACDCHYCRGTGVITVEAFVKLHDRLEELHSEEMRREIIAKEAAEELAQPFTVAWLCEIGGRLAGSAVFFESPEGIQLDYWSAMKKWTLDGAVLGVKITTRGDVLAWLNVLGIALNVKGSK